MKTSAPHAILLKILYFQRKHKEKHGFPLVIETYLLYLQRISIKPNVIMIIGREKEQRELLGLFDKEESYIRIPHEIGYICRKFS